MRPSAVDCVQQTASEHGYNLPSDVARAVVLQIRQVTEAECERRVAQAREAERAEYEDSFATVEQAAMQAQRERDEAERDRDAWMARANVRYEHSEDCSARLIVGKSCSCEPTEWLTAAECERRVAQAQEAMREWRRISAEQQADYGVLQEEFDSLKMAYDVLDRQCAEAREQLAQAREED